MHPTQPCRVPRDVAPLPLFRLQVPRLKIIAMGLIGGLRSIAYILLLLLLVFYIFGVAGISLFGDNDPFHFKTIPRALLTLFRAVLPPTPCPTSAQLVLSFRDIRSAVSRSTHLTVRMLPCPPFL